MVKKNNSQKSNIKKYAPYALWFSGVAFLLTVIGLVLRFFKLVGLFTPPNWFTIATWICLGLVVLGAAVYALLDPKRVQEFFTGRQAKYGSTTLISFLAFLGILIVVNVFAMKNPKNLDFTKDKQYTLRPETLQALTSLETDVYATAFFSQQASSDEAIALLKNYKSHSNGKFSYEFVDPDQNPLLAKQMGISGDGKIYLQMEDRHEIISFASEQEITSALIRLMNPGERAVYFLTGHGEKSIEQSGDLGFSIIRAALEAKNYTVNTLNLLSDKDIPEDALAIIIAGPMKPISAAEVEALKTYLDAGGSLIVMEDPVPVTEFGDLPDPLADYIATYWGISINNDFILDPNSSQRLVPFGVNYGDHPISQKLSGIYSFFPEARSLSVLPNAAFTPIDLVTTTEQAWGETDFLSMQTGTSTYDTQTDTSGPIILSMAATNYNTFARLVLFGDSDFASDLYYDQYANGDLLINSIDWAAEQEDMINLTSSEPIERQMKPLNTFSMLAIGIGFICLLPLLVIAGGIASWLARKSKG